MKRINERAWEVFGIYGRVCESCSGAIALSLLQALAMFGCLEGRFRFNETKLHQAARRIVDIDQRCTRGRTVLEPVVVATINLDQFAAAGPKIT